MKSNLYPIKFNGEMWTEKDCDEVFVTNYHSKEALAEDGSVYVGEGLRILPNGTWI